jgi:hypothetical protein
MAELVWFAARGVGSNQGAGALARVGVGVVVGTATYVGVLVLLRAPEIDVLRSRLLARGAETRRT